MRTALIIVLLAALTASACGDDVDAGTASPPGGGDSPATGVVAVHIEPVDGIFVEGFEVGLRFEAADGEVLHSVLWGDFVRQQHAGQPALDDFYDSVLEQEVPAGEVVVLASANVGIGPPPEIPDLDGELRCRLPVDVPAGVRVEVEVTFGEPESCLRLR